MYEIAMPNPWYEGQEHEQYWQVMAQIASAEEPGFDYTLLGGAFRDRFLTE